MLSTFGTLLRSGAYGVAQIPLICCVPTSPACLLSVQLWDNERVVLIPDHYIFTADPRANRNVDILR